MKKKFFVSITLGIFLLGLVGVASANTLVVQGNIDNNNDVDFWDVTLSGVSDLSINVLAREIPGVDFFGNGLNNDHLDATIYLFTLPGGPPAIGYNDDSSTAGPGGFDGSVSGLDSYLAQTSLAAGTYRLAIGSFWLSGAEAWSGVGSGGSNGLYQLTFDAPQGGMTMAGVVPEPATLLLLGSGLVGMIGFRKKKEEEEV